MSDRATFAAPAPGGTLDGWVVGRGQPVLLLHGGPGFRYDFYDLLFLTSHASVGIGFLIGAVTA